MPKKIRVPSPIEPEDGVLLDRSEHLELVRLEFAEEKALLQKQLAAAQDRAVRLEIAQAAQAAADGTRRAHEAVLQAQASQKAFAEQLAKRYHFDWTTHTYCPETGRVRRVLED